MKKILMAVALVPMMALADRETVDGITASITIVDGKVTISYTPELDDERKALRKYTTWGKKSLMDTAWTEVPEGHEAEYNFFKVSVEMR